MKEFLWQRLFFKHLYAIFFTCFVCQFFFFVSGEEKGQESIFLSLNGHLGKETIAKAVNVLNQTKWRSQSPLVIEINSTSGDLNEVLDLAKKIYEVKEAYHFAVVVYIDENAIGPAAIVPFLADKLITSFFVSWGDIPQGSDATLPVNLLRNRISSLISEKLPQARLLNTIAQAMIDKNIVLIDDNGWKIATDATKGSLPLVSIPGETLVLNQQELQKLHLIQGTLTLEKFHETFRTEKVESTQSALTQNEQTFEESLKKHIVFNPQEANAVGYIKIDDRTSGINQATWLYVKTALDYYKNSKNKPIFVILELNTPGGEVFPAQKISDALKDLDTQYNIPVIAFINNWAISAGAMLAYSTRFIAIVKDASMGAAEPVLAGAEGKMETASEKVNSALRADFANRAGFFGRNPYLAEAMVDKDVILVLRYGKIIKLDNESQIRTIGPNPDKIISPKGKLLTLNAEQLMEYGVANVMLPPEKLELITEMELEQGKWPARKMLLFQAPFFKEIPNATIDAFKPDWKTRFFTILANPIVSSLLVLGLLIGFYMEMSSPGFGVPGTVGLTCLFLILLSSFSLEAANWLEIILLLAGIAIILVDLLVLPTFGLLGIVGTVFFLAGLFGLMLPGVGSVSFEYDTKTFNAAGEFVLERFAWLCGSLVLGAIMIAFLAQYVMPRFTPFKRFVLAGGEQVGYIAGDNPKTLPQPGTKGIVDATLRPSGKVMIQGTIYDAMTSGEFIEEGSPIKVLYLDGSVIVVAKDSKQE